MTNTIHHTILRPLPSPFSPLFPTPITGSCMCSPNSFGLESRRIWGVCCGRWDLFFKRLGKKNCISGFFLKLVSFNYSKNLESFHFTFLLPQTLHSSFPPYPFSCTPSPPPPPILSQRIKEVGGVITTSESLLFELLRDKNHPQFSDCAGLLKGECPDSGLSALMFVTFLFFYFFIGILISLIIVLLFIFCNNSK